MKRFVTHSFSLIMYLQNQRAISRHKPLSQNAKVDKVVCSALVFVRCVLLKTVGDLRCVLERNSRQCVVGNDRRCCSILKGGEEYLSE